MAAAPFGCGNGIVEPGEQCDDGNASNLDDCNSDCTRSAYRFIDDSAVARYCDDGNPCTDDGDGPNGCTHTPNGVCCDSVGVVCSAPEVCQLCSGCFLYHWSCCDRGASCVLPVRNVPECGPDGTPCDDGDACTASDACRGGTCVGRPRNGEEGRACTADDCTRVSGCQHAA